MKLRSIAVVSLVSGALMLGFGSMASAGGEQDKCQSGCGGYPPPQETVTVTELCPTTIYETVPVTVYDTATETETETATVTEVQPTTVRETVTETVTTGGTATVTETVKVTDTATATETTSATVTVTDTATGTVTVTETPVASTVTETLPPGTETVTETATPETVFLTDTVTPAPKFNLLVGRHLQQEYGQEPQCILTMPLLEGLDGVEKMSKSKNNYIGISEDANTMFAKVLSISDALMWRWYLLLSFRSVADIEALKADVAGGRNPKDAKVLLAKEITSRFHSAAAADAAEQDFANRSKGGVPDDIPDLALGGAPLGIAQLLKQAGLAASASEGNRLIDGGGVRVDSGVVSDKGLKLGPGRYVVQVGKRKFARVTLS